MKPKVAGLLNNVERGEAESAQEVDDSIRRTKRFSVAHVEFEAMMRTNQTGMSGKQCCLLHKKVLVACALSTRVKLL